MTGKPGKAAAPLLAAVTLVLAGTCCALSQIAELESGAAVTDPVLLRTLEADRYSLGALLFPDTPDAAKMKNDNLFDGPLKEVGDTLVEDIDRLPQASLEPDARRQMKTPDSKNYRFHSILLRDPKSRFVLTGIVNRMDRAYRVVDGVSRVPTCGEIRFIYRFTYEVDVDGRKDVSSRLPLTASLVLNARNPQDVITCADIAKRWQEAGKKTSVAELRNYLRSDQGPLKYISSSQLDRIEFNFQLFRLPASMKPHWGGYAEYLLRIFRLDRASGKFIVMKLENQIDRAALVNDADKLQAFKKWLFSPAAIAALDRGLLDVPSDYLAIRATSVAIGGGSRSQNQPLFDVVTDAEIERALRRYKSAEGRMLETVKTADGFRKRFDGLTCSGCHQARTIAGFHFPGADAPDEHPNNAVHIPASAHFFGDIPRRKKVIDDFAKNRTPDFSHGFSERPDGQFKAALAGTQLFKGWGATCYQGKDASFADWTCAKGLRCKTLYASAHNAGMGTCITASRTAIGDPLEFGKVTYAKDYGNDTYTRTEPAGSSEPDTYQLPQIQEPPPAGAVHATATQGFHGSSGGFPAGMLWRYFPGEADEASCHGLPPEATCGLIVVKEGFNRCIDDAKPFPECLKLATPAGLRACDRANPCRDDYICTAPYKELTDKRGMGTCIPPYFMFQFRVDGHPGAFSLQQH